MRAALLAVLCGAVASAHEIGTTRVSVLLQDGRYDVEIVTDATALAEKLASPVGAGSDDSFASE